MTSAGTGAAVDVNSLEERTLHKIRWRLLPCILFLFIICYVDRTNIGYAALDMNKALRISGTAFGVLAGLFFLGYSPFEIPSNIMLQRVGARRWFSRIMVSWGLVVVLTGFVSSLLQLYTLRFLLGVAEAGFYPGVLLYFTFWFPQRLRSQAIAVLQMGIPISNFVGAPVATLIMDNIRWFGIAGWRWIFILEGIPAVVFGVVVYRFLTDRPQDADWLSAEEKNWLVENQRREHQAKVAVRKYTKLQAFLSPRVWRLTLIYFTLQAVQISIPLWLPTILKGLSRGLTNTRIGFLTMIPYIVATVAMLLWSRHSDRTGERKFHAAAGPFLAIFGLILFGVLGALSLKMVGMTIALVGLYCFYGPFWSLPSQFLSEESAAVGLATINSIAMIGGFVGPSVLGYLIRWRQGNLGAALAFLCVMLVVNCLLVATMHIPADKKHCAA
jgi:ACS family tartrate transporter-like MFS transporter